MLTVDVKNDSLFFGDDFALNFQRTIRIPDDGKVYPLPPGLGQFPILRVADYADKVPPDWLEHEGSVFIPLYQREALWVSFQAAIPHAVKIGVGRINAVNGKTWSDSLSKEDYMVTPPQPWLDGINVGKGLIRQFVAMPLGMGYTVEGQVTGEEVFGGVQIVVVAPKAGKFERRGSMMDMMMLPFSPMAAPQSAKSRGVSMGLGAGGQMKQKVYPDPHGIDTWDSENTGRVNVYLVNSVAYSEITGKEAPPSPISAQTYAQHNFPWFDLYDETMPDLEASETLQQVKSVKEKDEEQGHGPQQDDSSVIINRVLKYWWGRIANRDS